MSAPARPAGRGAVLGAALLAAGGAMALTWPVWADPARAWPVSAFGPSHVWGFDHLARMALGELPRGLWTDRLRFPAGGPAPLLGWAPALLTMPVRAAAGPVAAANAALVLAFAVAGAGAAAWMRASLGVGRAAAVLGGLGFALSVPMLNHLALGNLEKLWVGLVPLWLALVPGAAAGHRVGARALAAAAIGAAAAFTEPYIGLFLPFFAVLQVLASAHAAPARGPALARGAVLLAVTAAAMAPAGAYFRGAVASPDAATIFRPARRLPLGALADGNAPWVGITDVFALPSIPADPTAAWHALGPGHALAALGLLAALATPGRGRALVLAVTAVAALLSAGPYHLRPGAPPLALPVAWLEWAGYPTAVGQQYHRALPYVVLGLSAALARLVDRAPLRLRAPAAALVGLLLSADALRLCAPAFPRPVATLPCGALLDALAADPRPGAVLPAGLRATQAENGVWMLYGAVLGRALPTVALHTRGAPIDAAHSHLGPLRTAPDAAAAAAWARRAGFGWVLLAPPGEIGLPVLQADALTAALGPPQHAVGTCAAWALSP